MGRWQPPPTTDPITQAMREASEAVEQMNAAKRREELARRRQREAEQRMVALTSERDRLEQQDRERALREDRILRQRDRLNTEVRTLYNYLNLALTELADALGLDDQPHHEDEDKSERERFYERHYDALQSEVERKVQILNARHMEGEGV